MNPKSLINFGRLWPAVLMVATVGCSSPHEAQTERQQRSQTTYEPNQEFFEFNGEQIPLWNLAETQAIEQTVDTTFPYVLPSDPLFDPDYLMWDYWPIRNKDGSITQFGPWQVVVGMAAPRDSSAGGSGLIAVWRYWYTRGDGTWIAGGDVFTESKPFGTRTWAGSTM